LFTKIGTIAVELATGFPSSNTVRLTLYVPLVDFYWTPLSPFENESVQFTDNSSAYDMPISWFWQFGDSNTSTLQNPAHTYSQQGTYPVNLTVTDSDGSVVSFVQNIVVQDTVPENLVIIANPASPVIEGTNVSFTGFATAYDMPLTYEWDFDASNGITIDATGQVVGNLYAQQGTYTITLTARDNDGSTATTTYLLVVTDTVPTANAGPDQIIDECNSVQFNGSLSTAYDTPISYNWNWGDSTPAGTGAMPTHTYAQNGVYTVNLTVTDSDGSSASDILTVNVLDTIPNAFFTYFPLSPDEGSSVAFDSAGSTLNLCDASHTYNWTFGDGNSAIGTTAANTYVDQGSYVVTLTINDSDGTPDTYSLTIPVADVDPTITSLSFAPIPTDEGVVVTFSTTAISGAPGFDDITNYQWNYGDGSPLESGAALTNPTHIYGDNGTYTVTLTVFDEDSSTSDFTIVLVDNVAPTASAGGPYVCNPGGLIGPLAGTATDPAGINDPLTYAWDFDYTGTFNTDSTLLNPMLTCSLVVGNYTMALEVSDDDGGVTTVFTSVNVTAGAINNAPQFVPLLGVVSIVNNTLFTYDVNATDADVGDIITYFDDSALFTIDPNTGMISFTPITVGLINVNITACDDSGFLNNCTSDILGINVIAAANIDPIANANGPYVGQEGNSVLFDGSGSFDPDGTVTTWSWDFGDGVGTGAGVNPTYTYLDNGTYTVTLTVTDNNGGTNSTTSTTVITNVAPSVNAGGPYTGDEGTFISLNGASATDPAGINDPLTYEWDLDNDGIIFETPGQVVSFNASDDGSFPVGLRVSDDDGGVTITSAIVNVNNLAPTVNAGGPYGCTIGGTANVAATGTDPAGLNDPLTYAWDLDGIVGYETPGQIATYNCVSVGTFTIEVQANDGDGGLNTDTATVVVSAIPDVTPPVVTLQLPTDGFPSGVSTVTVQYTVVDDIAATLVCDIYSNTTGSWAINVPGQTTPNATSNSNSYVGIPDGSYAWNVQCSDGINVGTAPANFTFTVSTGVVIPACSNGLDDDSDLLIDYPFDPGCDNATDTDETDPVTMPLCSDGLDNDGDTLIDFPNDPGCTDAADNDETDPVTMPECYDLIDNDFDLLTDWPNDPGCSGAGDDNESDPTPLPACSDGIDNDGDTYTDFPNDPGCVSAGDNDETDPVVMPACFNTLDDDLDLLTDYPADPGCYAAGDDNESNAPIVTLCSDGIDNDGDTYADANDAGCYNALGVYDPTDNDETNAGTTQCSDGIDNDGDLLIDWPQDTDCLNVLDVNESTVVGNIAPVANASVDQTVLEGSVVTLDGSNSYDTDNAPVTPLTYNWTQVSGPATTIVGSTTVNPTFTATVGGTYVFQLVVFDGQDYSTADQVVITVNTVAESISTVFTLYNASGNPVTTVLAGQTVYAELSINNNFPYAINGVTSNLTATGFTIVTASDGNNDNLIDSNIPGFGVPTIWWQMTAPAAGSYTLSVDTEGEMDSRPLQVN